VFPANRFIDQSLDVFVPIARAALVTNPDRDGDSTEHIAFVRPLVKGDLFGTLPEVTPLAKVARLAILIVRHVWRPGLAIS
jgi:hypothetical protein